MKKERRIRKNEEFQVIIGKGNKVSSRYFLAFYSSKKLENNRIGISVSKKSGNAIVRNRIKRQVRMQLLELSALGLWADMILIIRQNYNPDEYETMKKDLENLIIKVKMKDSKKEIEDEKKDH